MYFIAAALGADDLAFLVLVQGDDFLEFFLANFAEVLVGWHKPPKVPAAALYAILAT